MADTVQEMSFKNVVDTILEPQGIKVGGYPDDLFIDMDEKDRERWQCNICYLVLRDPTQCDNKHKFCNTCVFAWSMTYGANSDKCPVCRSKQREYSKDVKIASEISLKWVKCPEAGCALRCTLRDFLQHSHGIKMFANSDSNAMDNVRQTRRPPPIGSLSAGAELVFLPTLHRGNVAGQGTVREGRNLLQDMLLVLHLEMELRRRAIDRFSSTAAGSNVTANQIERDRHVTEVLAIQEQMQEITGFLNILFSIPPQQSRRVGGMHTFPGPSHHDDSSSDSDDSDSSVSTVAVDSQYRLTQRNNQRQQQTNAVVTGSRDTSTSAANSTTITSIQRPLSRTARRSDIRQELQNITNTTEPARTAAATTATTAAARPRTGTNRIDINNNNPLSSTVGNDTAVANSVRRTQAIRERNAAVEDLPRENSTTPIDLQNTLMMPRASSTFQSALEQLPPIAASNSSTADHEMSTSQLSTSTRPRVTPAPHRRPAPPATQGRPLNTTRVRRRIPSSNSQTRAAAQSSSSQPATAAANNAQLSQPGSNNSTTSNQQSRPTLPATSGALLRARRRSEIHQQIHRDLSTDDNS